MQTVYDLKAQISRQEVSEEMGMGMDTSLDDSYPENTTSSEYDWDNDETGSVFVEPPSRSHSQSPTSFSTVDDQAFDDNQYSQSPNLMTYPEGGTLNDQLQGIIDWNHNCTKSSQWRSEQSPEIGSTHLGAFLDPNTSLTHIPTESSSYVAREESTDMEL